MQHRANYNMEKELRMALPANITQEETDEELLVWKVQTCSNRLYDALSQPPWYGAYLVKWWSSGIPLFIFCLFRHE